MGATTERIVVQVTKAQKQAIADTAKRLGLNVSELIRQAVQDFTLSADKDNIQALIDLANASSKKANIALDDALCFVADSNRRIAAMEKGKH